MHEAQKALTLFTCYLAAIVHDYEHKGVNNDFLIKSSDTLALRYNDISPLVGCWGLQGCEGCKGCRVAVAGLQERLVQLSGLNAACSSYQQHVASLAGLFGAVKSAAA